MGLKSPDGLFDRIAPLGLPIPVALSIFNWRSTELRPKGVTDQRHANFGFAPAETAARTEEPIELNHGLCCRIVSDL